MRFEWDEEKNLHNQRKHGLAFEDAQRLLESIAPYLEIFDVDHSETEDRFIAIGPIDRGLVVVIYAESEEDVVRIVGARMATKSDRASYRSYMDRRR